MRIEEKEGKSKLTKEIEEKEGKPKLTKRIEEKEVRGLFKKYGEF